MVEGEDLWRVSGMAYGGRVYGGRIFGGRFYGGEDLWGRVYEEEEREESLWVCYVTIADTCCLFERAVLFTVLLCSL